MDILDLVQLEDLEFLKKLKLEQLTSAQKLGDPTALKEALKYELPPLIPIKFKSGSSILNLRSSANLKHSSQLFNEISDKDEDGLIGSEEGEDALLQLDVNKPILKHALAFSVSGGGGGSLNQLNFGIKAGASLKTLAYFRHDKEDEVRKALLNDVKDMSVIFSLDQIKKLNDGEALGIITDANLSMHLNFEMSDVVSAGLSGISRYVGESEMVSLNVELGTSVGVNFAIDGAYKLVFVKLGSEKYEMHLKSAVSRSDSITARAGFTASFSNPQVIEKFLSKKMDSLLEQVTQLNKAELDAWENKLKKFKSNNLSLLDLSEAEQELANKLIERFGITEPIDKIGALLNKIGGLRDELTEVFKEVAKSKIEAGFNYEYSRISTEEILLRAEMDEDILTKVHKDLVLFNTVSFIDLAVDPEFSEKINVKEYLKEKTLAIKRSWGISIGVGKFRIGSTDRKELSYKSQESIVDNQRRTKVAFEGIRKYAEVGNLGGFGNDYWVSFNASMDSFSAEPGTADFDYGFSFFLDHDQKKFNKKDRERLTRIMDLAVLWNIVPISSMDSQLERLWKLLGKQSKARDITFSFSLNISSEAFDQLKVLMSRLISEKPERNLDILAQSFGAAMPYEKGSEFRSDMHKRRQAYGELWKIYFEQEGLLGIPEGHDFRVYTRMAEKYFKGKDNRLSRREGKYIDAQGRPGAGDNVFFGGLIRLNHPARHVKNFVIGLDNLVQASIHNNHKFEKILKTSFNKMQDCWKMQFCIKALGVYFLTLGRANNVEEFIDSKLDITYTDSKGKEQAILFEKGIPS